VLAPPVKIQVEKQQIPPDLLTCQPQPAIPALTMQSEVGLLLTEIADAGADCRAKLASIAALQTPGPKGHP
jgi:hypothetical protein